MKKTMKYPQELLRDLHLDRLLSESALTALAAPCDGTRRSARQAAFAAMADQACMARAENCREALILLLRAYEMSRSAKSQIDRYTVLARLMGAYPEACRRLTALADCGAYFAEAARTVDTQQDVLLRMEADRERLTEVLDRMRSNLLSVADKTWLTPCEENIITERERIAACGARLGLVCPVAVRRRISADATLADALCRLYADEAAQAEELCAAYAAFDWRKPLEHLSELRFLLEICGLVERARAQGIPHCIPTLAETPQYSAREMYDISLLAKSCERIVPNDVTFTEREPFAFLTGANGGGKTTYLRAVGINLVLACAGCPVFAREAVVYPFARIAAHMPRDERFDRTGRLDEERDRVERMLDCPSEESAFLLFNETFSGTDDARGFALLKESAQHIGEAGHFGLYVTHFHEVEDLGLPLLTAQIDPEDENRRTYRIVRRGSEVSSYAADILRKYRLDRESLRERRNGCEC